MFHTSQFELLGGSWKERGMRVGIAYYHGLPGSGVPEFDRIYDVLRNEHSRLSRIQVSHSEMQTVVLESGIDPGKVFLIPIGFDAALFSAATAESRGAIRSQLGLPEAAVVVGSFQKDGVGWAEGLEPKLIKGPDVFLRAIALMRQDIDDLHVLLTGPARGFVKRGLTSMGVAFTHVDAADYREIPRLYHALDVYIVASRQEGGPKAVLEAMASGVPLVTTRVGQATDLVAHGVNGWLADDEDADALAFWASTAINDSIGRRDAIANALQTAAANCYAAQLPLWKRFFDGFVEASGVTT